MSNIIIRLLSVDFWMNLLLFKSHSIKQNTVAHFISSFFEQIIYCSTQIHRNRTSKLYALAMRVRYFFALKCRFYLIRGPPVVIKQIKSITKEENTLDRNENYIYKIENVNGIERYYVSFIDANNVLVETEVTQTAFLALREFSRIQENASRSDRRHIEKREEIEIYFNMRNMSKQLSVFETTILDIKNRDLHNAISKLSRTQQRRVIQYFFEGRKLKEIAVCENCSLQAVHKSIKKALAKLHELLSKNR